MVQGAPARLARYAAAGPVRADCGPFMRPCSFHSRSGFRLSPASWNSDRPTSFLSSVRCSSARPRRGGAGIGNVIGDCFGTLGPASLFGFLGNFLYGYVPYLLWGNLGWLSSGREPMVRSWRQGVEYVIVCVCASMVCAVTIGWGVELLGLLPFLAFVSGHFFEQPGDGDVARPAASCCSSIHGSSNGTCITVIWRSVVRREREASPCR